MLTKRAGTIFQLGQVWFSFECFLGPPLFQSLRNRDKPCNLYANACIGLATLISHLCFADWGNCCTKNEDELTRFVAFNEYTFTPLLLVRELKDSLRCREIDYEG